MSEEPIRTNVGWALHGDNLFRGRSVAGDLDGKTTSWSALCLGLGHRTLTAEETTFLDDLAVAITAADPRIWPLKVAWLVGCYGSSFAAMAAAHQFLADAGMGPAVASSVGKLWRDLDAELAVAPNLRDGLVSFIARRKAAGDLPPGFGLVPGRPRDERIALIDGVVRRHDRTTYRFYALMRRAAPILEQSCGMQVNLMGALSACLLDLGLTVEQLGPTACVAMSPTLWANAFESARLKPRQLQCLPLATVHYVGPTERPAPSRGHRGGM